VPLWNVILIVIIAVLATLLAGRDPSSGSGSVRLETASKFDHSMMFTTLGTMGGPVADLRRSQPANLLHNDKQAVLIDSGDGTAEQLAKAGVELKTVRTVILSHLHIDHTGGLYALIAMRYQQHIPGQLLIYGPSGTKQTVDGLLAAQKPLSDLSVAENPRIEDLPASTVKVVEITDGSTFSIGSVKVTGATNSHYGSENTKRYQSLSFRFDTPDRSIVYTGDTGPSSNVQRLARGADLLVSEIIDPDAELAKLKATRSDIPFYAGRFLKKHFEDEHLTADQAGLLAQRSGARELVLTHNALDDAGVNKARRTIASHFKGPIVFADDLDNY
jgi:ribonuclease BN (tRNA processing enzyme)